MDRTRGLELIDARDPRVERIWRTLAAGSQPSFFLSWGWIENWLASLPPDELPPLAVVADDGAPSAAFFLGRRRVRRHLVMPSNALYFNATGSERLDDVCIEHNGLLAAPGARRSLAGVLDLLPGDWDELFLPAIDRYAFDDLGRAPSSPSSTLEERYRIRIDREAAAPFVDLDAVRRVAGGYTALLGSSTRAHLDRTRAALGPVDVEIAVDEAHALDIWSELLRLHARRAHAHGRRGAFADPWLVRFHRRLIERRLARGEIQLVRVRVGDTTIGCLYNFVFGHRVLFYQSGLAMLGRPDLRPAYLCHAAAVEYNALAGHAIYDLLGGRGQYKQNLATGSTRLIWLRVQRPLTRFQLEDRMRRWKHAVFGDRPFLALRPA